MKFSVITIFPEMFKTVFESGIISKAIKDNLIKIEIYNLRDFADNKHKQVDDRPYGGGAGMILMPAPLFKAINYIKDKNSNLIPCVIFLTPSGTTYNQELAENFASQKKFNHLVIICGRYEGIDERVIDKMIDTEVSIGDYVLSGGEIPTMVIIDSVTRLIPNVIKNSEFNKSESFSDSGDRSLLDFPQYTRPEKYNNIKVPKPLLSGNHKEIEIWRNKNRKLKS